MFPQVDEDLLRENQLLREERDEAIDAANKSAGRVAQLMERNDFLTALLLDMNARIMAALTFQTDCPIHGVAHDSHECAGAEDKPSLDA